MNSAIAVASDNVMTPANAMDRIIAGVELAFDSLDERRLLLKGFSMVNHVVLGAVRYRKSRE